MAQASKLYVKGIFERFAFLGTWLPNADRRLGDVGFQEGNGFKRMTSLADLKTPFKVRSGSKPIDFDYTSESGVTVRPRAASGVSMAGGPPIVEAGISIEFGREGAFLFQARRCRVEEIEDKAALGRAVAAMARRGKWERDWSVVDTVVSAESATIIVSNSQRSSLELSAKAPVALSSLGDLDVGLTVSAQSGDVIRFIAQKGLTPLFKLARAKQSFWSRLIGGGEAITFGGPAREPMSGEVGDQEVLEPVVPT